MFVFQCLVFRVSVPGLLFMVYGVWFIDYVLWSMMQGLGFRFEVLRVEVDGH